MHKKLFFSKTYSIAKRLIAILLCIGMLLSAGASFFIAFAVEADPAAIESQEADDIITEGWVEIEATDDPLLEMNELSAATLALLNREMSTLDNDPDDPVDEPKEPANDPPEQDPVSGDGTTIEKITIRWISTSTGGDGPAGFDRLTLEPESNKVTNQQFQIDFSLSGQTAYEPGDIEIIIPAYLWLDREGHEPGELTLSIPEAPETGVDFVWTRVGDNIVITNAKRLPAASKVLIQGTFRDVSAWEMKDETLSSDFHDFNATIVVTTSEGNELTMTSNNIEAYIDTSVRVTNATKTAYDSNSKSYNIYWESVPSALPEIFLNNLDGDPEDYVYIRWYISGTASGSQPFEMTVTDTVEDKYNGVMLGATNTLYGNVMSPNGKSVTATIFNGYTENYRTAYIWTAYPKDQFEEGEDVQFNNEQTITVTGWDDGISTTQSASASVDTWKPIHYKFVKIWDDNDDEMGVRPDYLLLKIYDSAYSYTSPSEQIYLTEEYADEEDASHWIYEWSDEGQPGHSYDVEEKLFNYEGDFDSRFDSEGHRLHWIYTLASSTYDPDTHTWEYVNQYDDGWIKFEISDINKEVEAKYQNNKVDDTTDAALNELLHDKEVEIQYPVNASLSAAKSAVGFGAKPNRFVLEDGTYRFNDEVYPVEDVNIGAVIMQTPSVWEYTNYDDSTGWFERQAITNQTVTLYGFVDDAWVAMATITTEGVLTAIPDSGATVTGRRVDLPDNTASVRTEIRSDDAAIVEMGYTVCLRLNPTPAMQAMVQRYLDREDFVMFPVYNKADGYVVYDGETDVNVEGTVYHPGEHLVDVTDMATGFVHGRQYRVAAELTKEFAVKGNDVINNSVIIHSKLTLTQQSNLTVFSEYQEALKEGEIPNTMSGIYYDLLPNAVSPDMTSIQATNGDTVSASYIIENYKNSGRTLLVVKVNNTDHITYTTKNTHADFATYPAKGYVNTHTVEFDSLVSWDIIEERGLDYMRNVAAYEADEEWIGSVTGWEGEPDDPSAGKNVRSGNAVGDAAEFMTGLHNNRPDPSFVYAGTKLDYSEIDVIATTSLWKYVQVNGTGLWANGQRNNINVEEGGSYVYQLNMKSAADTNTQDIIIIDSIENYVPTADDKADYGDEQWRGDLVSIDVSLLEDMGIKPVIYYSTVPDIDVSRSAMDGGKDEESVLYHLQHDEDENGNPAWTTDEPDDLGTVTAIAIDARKTVNDEDFILLPDESLTVYLHMRAPFEEDNPAPDYFKDTDGTDHLLNAHAYNAVYLDCLQNVEGKNTRDYINFSYTKVGIYTKYINVSKVWDDGNNADGYRPDHLTVRLLANGEETGDYVILNDENNWKDTFDRVHTYDENGEPIIYSYSEDDFENSDKYQFTFEQKETSDGHIEVILTNRNTPEQIDIPVTKTWDDENNAYGTRPDYVVVRLLADGVFTGRTLTLRADNAGNWSGMFTGLNKYRDGRVPIEYTIEEEYVDDYLSEVDGYTIKNTYYPQGDLIIHKTVENTTKASVDKDFTFDLQLVNDDEEASPVVNKYSYTIYNADGSEDSSGEIGDGDEFTLKGGQYIVIHGIPTHVLYTVTETSLAGFTQTYVSGDTGVIISGDNEAYFTNTYSSNGSFQLDVMKTLTGRPDLLSHQFKFILTDENGEQIDTASNDTGGKASFLPIKYTEANDGDEYTYFVKEENGGMPGYDYDDNIYMIKVKVTDNGKGSIECDVKFYKENGEPLDNDRITFNNTYEADGSLTLRLWKTIDREITPGEFTFDLFDENFILKRTASTDETGAVVFDELAFDETDIGNTYMFFAREQKGEDKTVKYSDTIIAYSVTVSDNGDGTLSFDSQSYDVSDYFELCEECKGFGDCGTCINGFGYVQKGEIELGSAVTPVIHNGLADGSLSVTKHVSSTTDVLPDDEFSFRIVLIGDEVEDGEFTYQVEQVEEVEFKEPEEAESTDNSIVKFFKNIWASFKSEAIYTVEDAVIPLALGDEETRSGEWVNGEFEFTLHGGQQALFSDIPAGTVYQIWEESANGWVLVSQSNTSGVIAPDTESKAEFSNRYQPEIATAVLMGVKYLDGKAANTDGSGNVFEFVLYDENDRVVEYVDAQAGGFITFKTLTFEEEGTYKYTIREVIGGNEDIHYDDHIEKVTVKVKHDDNGNLVATVEYDRDGVVFQNITMPGSLEITKFANGLTDANKDAEFKFRVKFYNPNGVPINDESFTWFVKDTESGDILEKAKGKLSPPIGSADSVKSASANNKTASISNEDIMPIAEEDHGGLFDSNSTGIFGTVRWSLYNDGTLLFEPVDGEDGILAFDNPPPYVSASQYPWFSYNTYSHQNIKTIESIGNIHVVGTAAYMFSDEPNLTDASALASWDMSQATSLSSMFFDCASLGDVSFLSEWDISNVMYMGYMLANTAISDLEMFRDWDFSEYPNLVSINSLFARCKNITDISPLADWNLGAIYDIGALFESCSGITDISPLKNWGVSNVIYFNSLFSKTGISDVSPLADWDTSSGIMISSMFEGCKSLKDVNALSGWNTSNVTYAGNMFQNSGIEDLSGVANWDMSHVTDMSYMFQNCTALTNVDALLKWDISSATTVRYMFSGCTSLRDISGLSRWHDFNLTYSSYVSGGATVYNGGMESMFENCTSLTNVDALKEWTFNTPINVQNMFKGSGIVNVDGLIGWDTARPVCMLSMFENCTSLTNIDGLSSFTFGDEPVNMQYMFRNSGIVNANGILGWNGAKVANPYDSISGNILCMFQDCANLTDITGLAGLDVSNCTAFGGKDTTSARNVIGLFVGCSSLQSLVGLDDWDVSNVTAFSWMFYKCSGLTTLEGVENWNICSAPSAMFERTGVVDASAIGSWTLEGIKSTGSASSLFYNNQTLTTLDFSNWNGAKISNVTNLWVSNNVSKITFGKDFWNGTVTSGLVVNPTTPPTNITTGYWINEDDEFKSDPTTYTSAELVSNKVVGTYIWQYLPPYEITFDGDGGSGSMPNIKNYYHLECDLPENTFVKPGYIFVGWHDGNGKAYNYEDGVITIPKNTYRSGESVTLYAMWEDVDADGRVSYTVEYYQQSADDPEQYALVDTVVEKAEPGYSVYVELERKDFGGFIIPDVPSWYYVPTNGYLTVQLYYDRVHYTIHFDGNGAEYGNMPDMEMVGGIGAALPESGFGMTTGAFLGWCTDPNGDGDWYYPGRTVNNLADDGETVTLYAQWLIIDQSVDSSTGEIIVSCKAGQTIVIQGLPAGITYEIEEIEFPAGWYYQYGSNESGTIISNGAAYAFVTNEYIAKGQAQIIAHKALDGASLSSGQFEFILEEVVNDVRTVIDRVYNGVVDTREQITDENGKVVDNPYNGTAPVIFDAIDFTQPGEYVYYITEIEGDDDSVKYDTHRETVRVIVTDNGDGTLASKVIYDNEKNDEPTFKNSMKPGDLVVSKTLSNGTEASKNVEFSFQVFLRDSDEVDLTGTYTVIKSDGTELEISNGDVVKIKADEQFTVCDLPHGCKYEVVELPQDGFTLTQTDGDTGEIEGGETSYAAFNNAYSASAELVLKATKRFIGGTISPEQFAFELVDQNSEHIETVYADENGNVTFTPIDFTESDVGLHFVYHIFEISMYDDHIIYDKHTADIAVTVVDKANGTIGFEMDYDEDELIFTNVAEFDLDVSKTVAGNMGNKAETFTFNMVLSNDEYELDNSVKYRKGEETGTLELVGDHYEFTLMHDETITFIGLPFGTEYVIVETGAENYGTSITATPSTENIEIDGKQVSDTLNANTAVSYENKIDGRVPTGVTMAIGWVGVVMILSLAVFVIIAKRKRA